MAKDLSVQDFSRKVRDLGAQDPRQMGEIPTNWFRTQKLVCQLEGMNAVANLVQNALRQGSKELALVKPRHRSTGRTPPKGEYEATWKVQNVRNPMPMATSLIRPGQRLTKEDLSEQEFGAKTRSPCEQNPKPAKDFQVEHIRKPKTLSPSARVFSTKAMIQGGQDPKQESAIPDMSFHRLMALNQFGKWSLETKAVLGARSRELTVADLAGTSRRATRRGRS